MKKQLPEVEPVVLKEYFGMRPGKLILIALIILVLLASFLLFFLPGIIKGGRYVSFTSSLSQIGVEVDGKYLGSTEGSQYFLTSGEHQVQYLKDGYVIKEETITIDHPVFFTLFVKRHQNIEVSVEGNQQIFDRAYATALSEIVAFSAVTDYDEYYNYKPIYTYLAKDAIALGIEDISEEIKVLSAFLTSGEMLEDIKAAASLLKENGIRFESDEYNTAISAAEEILSSSNRQVVAEENNSIIANRSGSWYTYPTYEFTIGEDTEFNYPGINTLPLKVEVPAFTIAKDMVSEYEYALFVEANPIWAKSNKDNLVKEGLVDEHYLDGISLTTATKSTRPIRNISYYAAIAYCEYLSSVDGVSYRLPTEAEFEIMAKSAEDKAYASSLTVVDNDTTSPVSVMGGLWEFTSSHYVPLSRVVDYDKLSNLEEADIIVKGGSYVNDSDTITAASVGVMRKDMTSEFAGIRLIRE